MWMLKFLVPYENLPFVLQTCEAHPFLSWYEDEETYTEKRDAQGFPLASQFFVEVYVNDDSLIEILKDFPCVRSPLPSVNLENLDISRKMGCFWINPLHREPFGLYIRAATAFGSGDHPTTRACLKALGDLRSQPQRILDLGCGSGILALACFKLWSRAHIIASDLDPESIRVSHFNAQLNNVKLHVYESKGFSNPLLHHSYDLIVSNILSAPLITLAKEMRYYAKGPIILSGLLKQQIEGVLYAYRTQGFYLKRIYYEDAWAALVLDSLKSSHQPKKF